MRPRYPAEPRGCWGRVPRWFPPAAGPPADHRRGSSQAGGTTGAPAGGTLATRRGGLLCGRRVGGGRGFDIGCWGLLGLGGTQEGARRRDPVAGLADRRQTHTREPTV